MKYFVASVYATYIAAEPPNMSPGGCNESC